jgi:hypothetical protein
LFTNNVEKIFGTEARENERMTRAPSTPNIKNRLTFYIELVLDKKMITKKPVIQITILEVTSGFLFEAHCGMSSTFPKRKIQIPKI